MTPTYNLMESTIKLLELITYFTEVVGYQINTQKKFHFYKLTNNNWKMKCKRERERPPPPVA